MIFEFQKFFNKPNNLASNEIIKTIFKLRKLLKDYTEKDYLLLTGDPAIIGVACSIAADITGGKYNLLKWDRQEHTYYPVEINLYEKGNIEDG